MKIRVISKIAQHQKLQVAININLDKHWPLNSRDQFLIIIIIFFYLGKELLQARCVMTLKSWLYCYYCQTYEDSKTMIYIHKLENFGPI